MTISTKGRYALRFMIDLASHGDDACVNLKEIAARQEISVKYLADSMNIMPTPTACCWDGFWKKPPEDLCGNCWKN